MALAGGTHVCGSVCLYSTCVRTQMLVRSLFISRSDAAPSSRCSRPCFSGSRPTPPLFLKCVHFLLKNTHTLELGRIFWKCGPERPFENGHFLVLPSWCCARPVFWRGVALARAA